MSMPPHRSDPAALTAMSRPMAPGESARVAWIDVARGLLILLVVLYHVTLVWIVGLTPPGSAAERTLEVLVAGMKPFRMPMFFLLSGLLAASAIARPWPVLLRRKTAYFAVLYLVWFTVQTVVQTLTDPLRPPMRTGAWDSTSDDGWRGVLLNGTVAPSYLWFIYALALYFPLAKLAARFGAWPLLPAGVAYLLSVQGWPGVELNQLPVVCAFFFWFYLGVIARIWIIRQMSARHPLVLGAALGLVVGGQIAEVVVGERTAVLLAVASVGAVVVGFVTARFIAARATWLARPLARLGRRTLPVYVLHMPVVWLLVAATSAIPLTVTLSSPPVALAVAVLAAGGVVAVTLVIHRMLGRPLSWLFDPPFGRAGKVSRRRGPRKSAGTPSESSAAS